jgi:hypothetical protein
MRDPDAVPRWLHPGLTLLGLGLGAFVTTAAMLQLAGVLPRDGVPVVALIYGVILLLAGLGDVRVLVRGALRGSARITRHMWRMCFAMFNATGSFFLGQADVIPEPLRIWPLLFLLAFLPLLAMLYYFARKSVRRRLSRERSAEHVYAPAEALRSAHRPRGETATSSSHPTSQVTSC